jgi:hypothetical protein
LRKHVPNQVSDLSALLHSSTGKLDLQVFKLTKTIISDNLEYDNQQTNRQSINSDKLEHVIDKKYLIMQKMNLFLALKNWHLKEFPSL